MKIASLDLNLLTALTALLEERHVSRAARRMGLSQSATSEALGRLRRHFGDELLHRVGNRYELTPLAAGLRHSSAAALLLIEQTFSANTRFDPAECEQEFVLLVSDYAASVYGPLLAQVLLEAAPKARLRLLPLPRESTDTASLAARKVAGFVMPRGMAVEGFTGLDLFQDTWMCLVDEDNPDVGNRLTLNSMAVLPWVVQDTTEHTSSVMTALRAHGVEPHVQCVVGDFHSVIPLVRNSRRIGLVPSRMITGSPPSMRVLQPPFQTPPLVETLWWHVAHTSDPAHCWLRDTAAAAGAQLHQLY
ncbi:LysR family transcriptional regulator [Lentzea pudingi]|uniref:LysR family transcriptional regulator n=1 Tax=Lentzea pudingi TaxID=1789439 RepID=A0ABQ2HXM9_9PSEU|nr:LysR family transcriptional regulator [Lentzea pudingi]GGM94689.1 LysR family transcriptional regulator [Lentzea pudingi]